LADVTGGKFSIDADFGGESLNSRIPRSPHAMSWMAREFCAWATRSSARLRRGARARSVLARTSIPSWRVDPQDAVILGRPFATFSTMHWRHANHGIADARQVSEATTNRHWQKIRRKLRTANSQANLETFLQSEMPERGNDNPCGNGPEVSPDYKYRFEGLG
jgi:predicted acylesterase/phospholipase RssA